MDVLKMNDDDDDVMLKRWVGLAKRYYVLQGGSKTADFGVT